MKTMFQCSPIAFNADFPASTEGPSRKPLLFEKTSMAGRGIEVGSTSGVSS